MDCDICKVQGKKQKVYVDSSGNYHRINFCWNHWHIYCEVLSELRTKHNCDEIVFSKKFMFNLILETEKNCPKCNKPMFCSYRQNWICYDCNLETGQKKNWGRKC